MFPFPSIDSLAATSSTAASFISAFLPLAGWMVGVGLAGIAIAFLIGLPQRLFWMVMDKWAERGAGYDSSRLTDATDAGRWKLYQLRERRREQKRINRYINS